MRSVKRNSSTFWEKQFYCKELNDRIEITLISELQQGEGKLTVT